MKNICKKMIHKKLLILVLVAATICILGSGIVSAVQTPETTCDNINIYSYISAGGNEDHNMKVDKLTFSNDNPLPGEKIKVNIEWSGLDCPTCVVKANLFGDWDKSNAIAEFYSGSNRGGSATIDITMPQREDTYNLRFIWAFDIGSYSDYFSDNLPSESQCNAWGDSKTVILDKVITVSDKSIESLPPVANVGADIAPTTQTPTAIANGDFETGDLTNWIVNSIYGGIAKVETEGTSFTAGSDSTTVLMNGDHAVNIRSSGPAPTNSYGGITSSEFIPVTEESDLLVWNQMSETYRVGIELEILDATTDTIIDTYTVPVVTSWTTQSFDLTPYAGQSIKVRFWQHTTQSGYGWYTLLDDIKTTTEAPKEQPIDVAGDDEEESILNDSNERGDSNSLLFLTDDFKDFPSLISKLKYSQDPLSIYLREHLSAGTQQLLKEYNDQGQPPEELQTALETELNQILQSSSLYDEQRFENIELSDEILELIEKNPQGQDLIEHNRLLLEEAYPQEIEKSEYKVKESKRIPGFMGFSLIMSILFVWGGRKFA